MKTSNLPFVKQAVFHLFMDQALKVPKDYDLPEFLEDHPSIHGAELKIDWQRVEKFLSTLSQDDLETFCIGDQDDMVAIAIRGTDAYDCTDLKYDGPYAYRALNTLFMEVGC